MENNQLNFDLYFLRIAREVSKNSKCLSRQIGVVLVKDNAIISTGYNGPPRSVKHCNERNFEFYEQFKPQYNPKLIWNSNICPRKLYGYQSGEGLFLCNAGHAERNALIQAARNGISTLGTSIYCFCPYPCKDCTIELINAGVKEIVCLEGNWYDNYSKVLIEESEILIRTIKEELI